MIRVTLGGEAMRDFPPGFSGGYVKLMLAPASANGKAVIRTYTIRQQHAEAIDLGPDPLSDPPGYLGTQ